MPRVARGLGWRLDGAKHLVWHGAAAAVWLVCARGEDGAPLLLAVPAGIAGARVTDTPTLDGARCARLDFDGVRLDAEALLAQGEPARQALAESLHWGTAALCAHAAGAMERLLEITVDYIKTRKQFGQPLASFQALQHRVAEMYVAKELALSMAYVAAAALTETTRYGAAACWRRPSWKRRAPAGSWRRRRCSCMAAWA